MPAVLMGGVILLGSTGCGAATELIRAASSSGSERTDHSIHTHWGDGELPPHVTVFDDTYPGITRLDPDLLVALRAAAKDARREGVEFYVNSGWRSKAYQKQLFGQAVVDHGSAASAARWAARPGRSVHEAGGAVDLGPGDAQDWLARHGAAYGVCQIYRNEPWHYELRPAAADHGCPRMYADPAQDPRLR